MHLPFDIIDLRFLPIDWTSVHAFVCNEYATLYSRIATYSTVCVRQFIFSGTKLLLWLLRTQEKPAKGVDPEEETFRQFVIRHKKPYLNDKNGEFLKTSSCDLVFLSCG